MTAPAPPQFVVSVEATLSASAEIDLVTWFASRSGHDQVDYAALAVRDHGYTDEFERPLAYLMACAAEDFHISGPLYGRGVLREDGDVDEIDARLARRSGVRVGGEHARWTRADYDALCDAVPWLAEHRAQVDPTYVSDLTWPHLSRTPGPLDTPLIGEIA